MNARNHLDVLKALNQEGRLVLFVGAGISFHAIPRAPKTKPLPMWSELAQLMAKDASEVVAEYKDVLDLFDGIIINRGRSTLEHSLRTHLDDRNYDLSDTHRAIINSGIQDIYTTNYDGLLSRRENVVLFSTEEDYDQMGQLGKTRIFQIHGNLDRPHTVTRAEFRNWETTFPRAAMKLKSFLAEKTFLFVGYSLNDPHLTDGLLPLVHSMTGSRTNPHYAWMWKVSDRQAQVLFQRDRIQAISVDDQGKWVEWIKAISVTPGAKFATGSKTGRISDAAAKIDPPVLINAYKLFYHRKIKNIAIKEVARAAGLTNSTYKSLEYIRPRSGPPSTKLFKRVSQSELLKIEQFLGCEGMLAGGLADDLRTQYIEFYLRHRSGAVPKTNSGAQHPTFWQTKCVVFDFDGTLTFGNDTETTWEKIWVSLGFDLNDCSKYHDLYTNKRITHRQWCDITRDHFRDRNLSREQVKQIAAGLTLVDGVKETIDALRERGIKIYILSGSIKEIIRERLGELYQHFEEVKANEFVYDEANIIKEIKSTKFDFEGKAEYLQRVADDEGIATVEILFIGNSINDEFASTVGVRTLCVNPTFTHAENRSYWTDSIRRMRNMTEILKYTERPLEAED